MSEKMKVYGVPFCYSRYGRIEVIAKEGTDEKELIALASKELENMSTPDMDAITSYLEDSLRMDEEGEILDWGEVDVPKEDKEELVAKSEYAVNIYDVESDGSLSFAYQLDCCESLEYAQKIAHDCDTYAGAPDIKIGIVRIDYNEYDDEIGTEFLESIDPVEIDLDEERC